MKRSIDLDAHRRIVLASLEKRLDAHFARDRAELEARAAAILEAGGRTGIEVALGCGRPHVVDLSNEGRLIPPMPVVFPEWQRAHGEAMGLYQEAPPRRRAMPSVRFEKLAQKTDEKYAATVMRLINGGSLEVPRPPRNSWRARLADLARRLADRIDP